MPGVTVYYGYIVLVVLKMYVLCEENLPEKNFNSQNIIERPTGTHLKKYLIKANLNEDNKYYRITGKPTKFLETIIRAPVQVVAEKLVNSPLLAVKERINNGVVGARPTESASTVAPTKDCPRCKCGETLKKKRIVGGIETMVNEYPWMTALLYQNRFYCGASLINNKYILSAAHCVNGFSKDKISAVFLDHDRANSFETQTIVRKIRSIYRHRSYQNGGNYNNDIAVLQLDQEVPLTGKLKPVCLPPTGKSFTGYEGVATGWGAVKEHGQISNKLREVRVPIMSNVDCRKTGYGSRITDNMICAGYKTGMKDSCQGDSGGPLHVVNGSFHQIVGIVSWGEGCAQSNYPGVYTRVNRYISWIKSNTRDACYC